MTNTLPAVSRILIVEDEAPFRDVLATALAMHGYSVAFAPSGGAAEDLLNAGSFDLIITDVLMPDGDGLELIMDLFASRRRIPVIAMTGSHRFTELYLKTAKALGARRVLTKPFAITELLDATHEALSEGRAVA